MHIQHHSLLQHALGTERQLTSFHFGQAGSGGKTYIQASLHADEIPGMLVLYYLKQRLIVAELRGEIQGEIVLVPVANPLGLAQTLLHTHIGRFDLVNGCNFNRDFNNFSALIGDRLEGTLTLDECTNRQLIRHEIAQVLSTLSPTCELEAWRKALTCLSYDADVVLDLHCDAEAILHLYAEAPYWPKVEPLARYLEVEAVLLSTGSGGYSFDEGCSLIWTQLAARFADRYPVPLSCMAVTVELRGETQVDHTLATRDADRLYRFLQHSQETEVTGSSVHYPALRCSPTPYDGGEILRAPCSGILVFLRKPGDEVSAGESVAEIIDPLTDTVTAVCVRVTGILYARTRQRFATCGAELAKVTGLKSVPGRGLLAK